MRAVKGVDKEKHSPHISRVTSAPQKLIEWREKNEVSLRTCAKLFGCAPSGIKRMEEGTRRPSLDVAFEMEDEGVCPARLWRKKRKRNGSV